MQDSKNQAQNPEARRPSSPPQPMKGDKRKRWIIIIAILLLAAVGGFLIVRGLRTGVQEPTPTPFEQVQTPEPTPTPEPVDRSEIEIEILNGTGIAGEAGRLQGILTELGYEQIEVGNADNQDYTETVVTFSADVPDSIVDEITEELEDIYQEVEVNTSRSQEIDVRIIVGLREGQTPLPEETPTPTPTPTASPTASPSAETTE